MSNRKSRARSLALAIAIIATTTYIIVGLPTHSVNARSLRTLFARNNERATSYVTTPDASRTFTEDPRPLEFSTSTHVDVPAIVVDETTRYQTVDGFGAELTGSSAYVITHLPDHGQALLHDLFDVDRGIGLSYIRLTIGSSDFSLGSYSYDDVARGSRDPELAQFSLARDADILSTTRSIRDVSRDVRFIASPWTAPAWMKSTGALFGGTLLRKNYDAYARYLVDYVRALGAQGITLDALTPQNEPLLGSTSYPSMVLSANDEATLIKTFLGPRLSASFPDTKLIINDHNWDGNYPLTVLRDAAAARYVNGSAFHCYAGNVGQMSHVQAEFHDKAIYLTECSGGDWSPSFRENIAWDTKNLVIGATTNWARTVLLGNIALDDAGGPTNGGCADCRGIVTVHADGSYTRNVEYYVLEHVAKLVRPGAVRIGSSSSLGADFRHVAFVNVDGSKVLIVQNGLKSAAAFAVMFDGKTFSYSLPSGAIATFRWD